MKHNPKDVAIKIIMGFAKDGIPSDVGLGGLTIALILCAKQQGFTDEQMVEIIKTSIDQINKDSSRQ
jgi:hypothetical protein